VVRAAAAGRAEVSPRLAFLLMQRVAELHGLCEERGLDPDRLRRLTSREREVLRLLGRGLSNASIGRELSIRVSTVKSHVHRILRKLDVSRREEAARYLVVARGLPPERSTRASTTAPDWHGDGYPPSGRAVTQ
jgi:DNA-binding NarL/FixJ family response regulator